MSNQKPQLIRKLFSLHPKRHIDIINHFIEDGRHTSESDVVRQALNHYYDYIYKKGEFNETNEE